MDRLRGSSDGGSQARSEPWWNLSLVDEPWRAALALGQSQTLVVLEAAALTALALSLAGARRSRQRLPRPDHPAVVVALGFFALGIAIEYAAMTEAGFSGNVRYVLPALVTVAVLGGVGVGLVYEAMTARIGAVLGGCSAALLLALAGTAGVRGHVATATADVNEAIERSRLHADLDEAIDRLGPHYITSFGPPAANRALQTHLAWSLSLRLSDIPGARGQGMLFRTAPTEIAGIVRVAPRARRRILLASVGDLSVSVRPPRAAHFYTWPIVRFRLRTAAAATAAAPRCHC